jgi:hypothetical protein
MFILNVYLCMYFNCAFVSSSFLPKKMFHVSNANKQKHKALCRAGAFNLQRTSVASVQPGELEGGAEETGARRIAACKSCAYES